MAATLTEAMLQDAHIGCAELAILPYNPGSTYTTPTDFSAADKLYTMENTLQFENGSPSLETTRIDQKKRVLDAEFGEDADYTVIGDVPCPTNLALMSYFFEEGAAVSGVKAPDGDFTYAGKGYGAPKTVELVMLVTSQSKKSAFILNHVKMRMSYPKGADNTSRKVLSFVGGCISDVNGMVITPLPTATAVVPGQ